MKKLSDAVPRLDKTNLTKYGNPKKLSRESREKLFIQYINSVFSKNFTVDDADEVLWLNDKISIMIGYDVTFISLFIEDIEIADKPLSDIKIDETNKIILIEDYIAIKVE
jgi:hypothetical protein